MADESRRRYLFVAIDRATRWVFIRIFPAKTAANARRFLRDLERACPIRIRTILTDNGKEFTDRSYARFWVMRPDQAARVSVSRAATPSVNVTPSMTRGNWFAPFRRRQVFAAVWTSLKTISFAVFCESAPLVRTVRCRTVAKTLSIGLPVRR